MIDRNTFRAVMGFVTAMLTAAAWRMSTLPDWTRLPRYGFSGAAIAPIHSAILLVQPASLILAMIFIAACGQVYAAPDRKNGPWRQWFRLCLIAVGMICTAAQALIIVRSLGLFLTMNPILFARGAFVATGLLLIVMYNVVPKLPRLRTRIAFFELDQEASAKLRRFQGWLGCLLGLAVVLCGLFLPVKVAMPVTVSLNAAFLAAVLLFLFTAKRGQPQ